LTAARNRVYAPTKRRTGEKGEKKKAARPQGGMWTAQKARKAKKQKSRARKKHTQHNPQTRQT